MQSSEVTSSKVPFKKYMTRMCSYIYLETFFVEYLIKEVGLNLMVHIAKKVIVIMMENKYICKFGELVHL